MEVYKFLRFKLEYVTLIQLFLAEFRYFDCYLEDRPLYEQVDFSKLRILPRLYFHFSISLTDFSALPFYFSNRILLNLFHKNSSGLIVCLPDKRPAF